MNTYRVPARGLVAALVGLCVLTLSPAVADVAFPTAVVEKGADEECPAAEDLTVDDVELEGGGGCVAEEIVALITEDETFCTYQVEGTCGSGGSQGGCSP